MMQQKQIEKMKQVLTHQKFAKKVDLGSLKSDVDKLGIDKLKTLPSNLNNLKSKRDKLNVGKLVPVTVDLCK